MLPPSETEQMGGAFRFPRSLVPKFHLGTPPVLREIPFRADSIQCYSVGIGHEMASTSAFPSAIWERGNHLGTFISLNNSPHAATTSRAAISSIVRFFTRA